MKLVIMSDIHGNLGALQCALQKIGHEKIEGAALLGDLIDYGMRSNEVIDTIGKLPYPILCNVYGNHEEAVVNRRYERFSSQRGMDCARYTRSILTERSISYIQSNMESKGIREFEVQGKKFLAVHGSLRDPFWKSIDCSDELTDYARYDYVLSGHSHRPHFFEKYYHADSADTRNKKKTIFINPGSVGQPRNLNNRAQFAVLDTQTEEIRLIKVAYDIVSEQNTYNDRVDEFYKIRLQRGV